MKLVSRVSSPPSYVLRCCGNRKNRSHRGSIRFCCCCHRPQLPRLLWLVFAIFQITAVAGSFFGWANMSSMLEDANFLAGACPDGRGPCDAQTLAIGNLFTTGYILCVIAPVPSGLIQDSYGPRAAIRIMSLVFGGGVVSLAFAARFNVDALFYVGFACVGAASDALLVPVFHVANLFPEYRGLATAAMNGAYDAGTIVYFLMARVRAGTGTPLGEVFAWYGLAIGVVIFLAFFVWPKRAFDVSGVVVVAGGGGASSGGGSADPEDEEEEELEDDDEEDEYDEEDAAVDAVSERGASAAGSERASIERIAAAAAAGSSPASSGPAPSSTLAATAIAEAVPPSSRAPKGSVPANAEATESPSLAAKGAATLTSVTPASPTEHQRTTIVAAAAAAAPFDQALQAQRDSSATGDAAALTTTSASMASVGQRAKRSGKTKKNMLLPVNFYSLRSLPVHQQLLSTEFCLFAAFHSLNVLRYVTYVGSVDAQLNAMGQDSGGFYTGVFGNIVPFGCLAQFVVGPTLDRLGVHWTLGIEWALGVLLGVLNLIPSLQLQIATFVVFAFYRSFIFSSMTSYAAQIFGYKSLGITLGVVSLIAGAVGALQSVFFSWGVQSASFMAPNVVLAVAQALTGLPMLLLFLGRLEKLSARRLLRAACCCCGGGGGGVSGDNLGEAMIHQAAPSNGGAGLSEHSLLLVSRVGESSPPYALV